jgi:GT2 family glycosyltransferase
METLPAWPCVPAAVRSLHLDHGIVELTDLAGYCCVMVVFRFQQEVIGRVYLPVINGRVLPAMLKTQADLLNIKMARMRYAKRTATARTASVIVCTRDRTSDLSCCLPHLAGLVKDGHEVIVVDSCPSDDSTQRLVATYPSVKYVFEPCPGLSIARNRGIQAATREFIAFTDDDAEVDPFWLPHQLRNFEDPAVAMVTGVTLPIELEKASQIWFEVTNTFSRGFERRTFDVTNIDPLSAGVLGAGVNTGFRRSVFEKVGLFDPALGPGTPARAADDLEMFYRILAAGYRAVYDPGALVWHHHRRDWPALRSTVYNYGVAVYAWWAGALVLRREYGLLRLAPGWFLNYHVRQLLRALFNRPGAIPRDLAVAEFKGALMGPYAYFKSRRTMTKLLHEAKLVQRRDAQSDLPAHAESIGTR